MLPTPATRRWSSRKALIGARDVWASEWRWSPVKSRSSGSTPRRASKKASSASPPTASSPVPKRRGSSKTSSWSPRSMPHAHVPRRGRGVEQQRPRHAQVHQQEDVVGELPHEVLAAARELVDHAALDRRCHLGRGEGARPAGVEDLDGPQRPAFDVGRQVAADRLDFGELGHRPSRLEARMRRGVGVDVALQRRERRLQRAPHRAVGQLAPLALELLAVVGAQQLQQALAAMLLRRSRRPRPTSRSRRSSATRATCCSARSAWTGG